MWLPGWMPRHRHRARSLLLVALLLGIAGVSSGAPVAADDVDTVEWPHRRFAPCGAIDPATSTLYAFGGRADDGSTHHGDLWALDLGDGRHRPAWHLAAPSGAPGAPPAVRSCAAVWEPSTERLLVFGGWDGGTHDGGLRAFDPTAGAWTDLCPDPTCGAGPSPRRASQLVVDELRQRVLLFGGTSGPYSDELWAFDLVASTWQRITAPGPISRGGHSMVVDPAGEVVWLFGGTRPGADLSDLWRLDLATDTWVEIDPSCAAVCPSPRSGASLVADPVRQRLVLYGGWESATNTYRREAWVLDDLGGTPTWSLVDPASEAPQARFFHIAGYDPARNRMVVFGGGANGRAYKDAFALTLPTSRRPAAWHTLSPTTTLTARDQAAAVIDDGVLTVFGGFGAGSLPGTVGAGTHLADTWQRQLIRRSPWHLATPANSNHVPITREGAAFALDQRDHRLLLFGGLTGDTTLADVWVADLQRPGRPRWQQLCSPASCGGGPSSRWGAHAVYDDTADRLVVFGGLAAGGVATNDVWALDLTGDPTWVELAPDGPRPPGRWSAAYGFDPVRRRMVVFGGQTGPDASSTSLQDTWALSLDDPRWTELATTGRRPIGRRSPAGAIRSHDGQAELVIAMGYTPASGQHHDDVWSLDLGDDTASWDELDAGGDPTDPTGRRSATGAYDAIGDRFVMAFGRAAGSFTDELWSFDVTTRVWALLTIPTYPL